MPRERFISRKTVSALGLAVLCFSERGWGQSYDSWQGVAGDWTVPGNWTQGVPDDNAQINNGGTAQVTTTVVEYAYPGDTTSQLGVGDIAGGVGALQITGSLNFPLEDIGDQGAGSVLVNGGGNYSSITLGSAGGTGTYVQSGGQTGANSLTIGGPGGTGSFSYTGAANTDFSIADNLGIVTIGAAGGIGSFSQSGGGIEISTLNVGGGGTGTFVQSGGENEYNTVNIATTGGTGNFSQTGGTNSFSMITIGGAGGTGGFTQTGGNNGIGNTPPTLVLGAAGGAGNFNLNGTLTCYNEYVGYSGSGTFVQSGGKNTTSALYVGYNVGSVGIYSLSGGTLQIGSVGVGNSTAEFVGSSGTGAFVQTGGTNNPNVLRLGVPPTGRVTGFGTYTLAGNGTLTAEFEFIGSGVFTQTGGLNTAVQVNMGSSSLNDYDLQGGTLTTTYLNIGSNSNFVQTGGKLSFTNFTQGGGSVAFGVAGGTSIPLILGASGAGPSYSLTGGTLTVPTITVNSGGTFSQTGGTLTAPTITVNSGGVFSQAGGTLIATTFNQKSGAVTLASVNLSGTDVPWYLEIPAIQYNYTAGGFGVNAAYVGNNGNSSYSQSQTSYSAANLEIGVNASDVGVYTLSGTGSLSAGNAYVGYFGTGTFNQTGGTNSLNLYVGDNSGANGTYLLSGGKLSGIDSIGAAGAGAFAQSGGTNSPNSFLLGYLGSYVLSGGALNAIYGETVGCSSASSIAFSQGEQGTFNQTGGTNLASSLNIGYNSYLLSGFGEYSMSGGTLTVGGTLTNGGKNGDGSNVGTGTFSLQGGTATVGSLANMGMVAIAGPVGSNNGANLTITTSYAQTSGLSQVDGLLTFNNPAILSLSGGTLKGTGTINGPVSNTGGIVSPGDSPGLLTITGTYSQDANSTLDILIDGTQANSQYSVLSVGGAVTLNGTLDLLFGGGYSPQIGDTYNFLTANGLTGQFSTIESPYPVQISYSSTGVSLTVVPEPAGLGLIGLSLALFTRRKSRR